MLPFQDIRSPAGSFCAKPWPSAFENVAQGTPSSSRSQVGSMPACGRTFQPPKTAPGKPSSPTRKEVGDVIRRPKSALSQAISPNIGSYKSPTSTHDFARSSRTPTRDLLAWMARAEHVHRLPLVGPGLPLATLGRGGAGQDDVLVRPLRERDLARRQHGFRADLIHRKWCGHQ